MIFGAMDGHPAPMTWFSLPGRPRGVGYAREMPAPEAPPPRNGAGLAALVLGIVACAFSFVPGFGELVAAPAAVASVATAFVGWDRIERGVATNRMDTVVGGVLGAFALGLTLLVYLATHG